MIDLTPMDVRKKKDDFRRTLRGYDPAQVDSFLELVADRWEELFRERRSLTEALSGFKEQLKVYRSRERALNEALLTAQELREDARAQAEREAGLLLREAESQAEAAFRDADARANELTHEAEANARAMVREAELEKEMSQRRLDELKLRRKQLVASVRDLLKKLEHVLDVETAHLSDTVAPSERAPVEKETADRQSEKPRAEVSEPVREREEVRERVLAAGPDGEKEKTPQAATPDGEKDEEESAAERPAKSEQSAAEATSEAGGKASTGEEKERAKDEKPTDPKVVVTAKKGGAPDAVADADPAGDEKESRSASGAGSPTDAGPQADPASEAESP